jgi:hypothetical protein
MRLLAEQGIEAAEAPLAPALPPERPITERVRAAFAAYVEASATAAAVDASAVST